MPYVNSEKKKSSRAKWKRNNPDKHKEQTERFNRSRSREYRVDFLYGEGAGQHQREQLALQCNRCAICEEPLDCPDFDHNHTTGQWRGALCRFCNTGIGLLGESISRLQRAVAYLQKWDAE